MGGISAADLPQREVPIDAPPEAVAAAEGDRAAKHVAISEELGCNLLTGRYTTGCQVVTPRLGVHDRSSLWQLLEPPEALVEEQIGGYGGYAGILGITTDRFVFFSTREPESAFWIIAPLGELLEVLVQGPARPLRGARIGLRFRRQPDRAPLRLMTHGGGVERAQELADAANRLSLTSSKSADARSTSPALTITESAQRRIQSHGGTVWIHPNEVSEPSASYQPQLQTRYF